MAYTARKCLLGALIELSKEDAPALTLEDFNYYINKAIQQVVNKNYNIYDLNQQQTDNMRVLKATAVLDAKLSEEVNDAYKVLAKYKTGKASLTGATYEVVLPDDYLHILNCTCVYKVNERHGCFNEDDYAEFPAIRLTADSWSTVQNNYYHRPTYSRPYYYIHHININTDNELTPTNPIISSNPNGTDISKPYNREVVNYHYYRINTDGTESEVYVKGGKIYSDSDYKTKIENISLDDLRVATTTIPSDKESSNFPRVVKLNQLATKPTADAVELEAAQRYGNASKVRMEIRYGKDRSVYELVKVLVDYVKTPQYIRLTQEQMDLTQDTSQIMEFPDYECNEIINELVHLIMGQTADPRLQVHPTVTQSIASPVQQQNK